MPRYPTRSLLPPLSNALPDYAGLEPTRSKLHQVVELLRKVCIRYRTTRNITFYSTREIALFFKISQNTAVSAVRALEKEGFLRRVRGSQTLLLGKQIIARSQISAVVGLLLWNFANRFSEIHGKLATHLAEQLWPYHIAVEIIPHFDIGDDRPDLNDRLKLHPIDFAVWPFPFPHHREHILQLEDRGVRNLITGINGVASPYTPQVIVDMVSAYQKLLRLWNEDGIERVIVIEPCEFPPRKRLKLFARLATEMGFECVTLRNSHQLPASLVATEKGRIGIALLDEHSTAEFVFYDPKSFLELLRRHRILFGNGYFPAPFVPDGEHRVDRIFIPETHSKNGKICFVSAITHLLLQWTAGDFSSPPITVPASVWPNGKLWRYL